MLIYNLYCTYKRNWTEKTDPVKFVFEDIAIASWLISLWELERIEQKSSKLQSFIDLGCGNGLLTFLLSSEGYTGFGIDLRKRKIWDKFIEKGANLIGKFFYYTYIYLYYWIVIFKEFFFSLRGDNSAEFNNLP